VSRFFVPGIGEWMQLFFLPKGSTIPFGGSGVPGAPSELPKFMTRYFPMVYWSMPLDLKDSQGGNILSEAVLVLGLVGDVFCLGFLGSCCSVRFHR